MTDSRWVLIADDHPPTVAVCADALRARGLSVCGADSLPEARTLLLARRPAVLLLDAALDAPESVADCCRCARDDLRAPVVLLLPPLASAELCDALAPHADRSLQKPFEVRALVRNVADLIGAPLPPEDAPEANVRSDSSEGNSAFRVAESACGYGPETPPLAEIAGCRLECPLGRGAMGVVWRGRHVLLGVHVAVKLVPAARIQSEPGTVQRFLRGAQAVAAVHHPNVVPVLNAGVEGGWHFLVQRFVDGGTLQEMLDRRGPLPEAEALPILRDIAGGLAAIHEAGVIHRDLKPSNVMVSREGRALVTDFGLARPLEGGDLTGSSDLVGTPLYMAPEQCEGRAVDVRADLYALGGIAYLMLSGALPVAGATPLEILRSHVEGTPRPLIEIAPEVSAPLADLVHRLLAKRPDARPPTAAAVAEALARLLRASPA